MYTLPSLISRRERRPSELSVGMRITMRENRLGKRAQTVRLARRSMRVATDLTRLAYLYRDLPWMVVRFEKTDRSFSCLGHDWMFKISDDKTDESR